MSGSSGREAGGPHVAAITPGLVEREAAALLPTYRRRPIELVSGHGMWLVDAAGREHLDFLSGLSVTALGHAHPEVAEAIAVQARTLVHTSNLFHTAPQVELAERLKATLGWPDGKAFLCSSGAEANEAALKLARRHGKRQHPGKVRVIALEGGFHGRTMGALLATGNPAKHEPFQPLGDWVTHVPHDDAAALEAAVDDDVCAILVEVVQGEGGVRAVPREVLEAARAACDRVGALLLMDEVQTGVGRLGAWFGWQTVEPDPVVPDVVSLAKALANGLPVGAIVARGQAAEAFGPGDHATTFGGGPVICAAALKVLEIVERDGLVARAAELGVALTARLTSLVDRHDLAVGVRGRGLLQALVLGEARASDVVTAALDEGLVVNDVAPDVIRLAPPLLIDDAALDELDARLGRALGRTSEEPRGGSARDA